jgi:hypothetical protein
VNGDIYMSNTTLLVNERGSCVRLNGSGNGFKMTCNGLVSGALAFIGPFTDEGSSCGIAVAGQNYVIELNGVTQGRMVLSSTTPSYGVVVFAAAAGNTIVNNGLMRGGAATNANIGDAVNMPINLLNFLNNYGTIEASATQRAIVGGLLTHYSGAIVTDNFVQVAAQPKAQRMSTTFMDARFNLPITSVTNGSLRTAGLLTGFPPESKVEDGEVYGPSGEFTGELSPVNVDTAQLATDLFDAIIASSDPLAVRLKNTATVSTVNDAIGSLNVIP